MQFGRQLNTRRVRPEHRWNENFSKSYLGMLTLSHGYENFQVKATIILTQTLRILEYRSVDIVLRYRGLTFFTGVEVLDDLVDICNTTEVTCRVTHHVTGHPDGRLSANM